MLCGVCMGVEYSGHALLRLRVRGIEKSGVEEVLLSPREVYFDAVTGRFVAVGERAAGGGHWLIVVYDMRDETYHVVAVVDAKSLSKIARRRLAGGRWVKVW